VATSRSSVIADAIVRAVSAKKPRPRYVAGEFAVPILTARRFLPDRAFDSVMMFLGQPRARRSRVAGAHVPAGDMPQCDTHAAAVALGSPVLLVFQHKADLGPTLADRCAPGRSASPSFVLAVKAPPFSAAK
jgi:hypothetical protein